MADADSRFAFSGPHIGQAFPSGSLSVESGDYKTPRVSGGVAVDLGSNSKLEAGGGYQHDEFGHSPWNASMTYRRAF